jgi:predicted metal-binding protein
MKSTPKNAEKHSCLNCNFICCKKSDWDRHINTSKHKNRTISNILEQKTPKNADFIFVCKKCNKGYNARNSLWYHEKKCEKIIETNDETNKLDNEMVDKDQLILMLIKQNSELIKETSGFKNMMMEQQNMMLEVIKNGTHNNNNNTINTNSHNKTFNLQFFLNETCKDAMNIMDFVDSIKLQLSDLENVGKNGYVEGISNIIVKNLNLLDESKRPVHCTDSKREVMYVKDENKWEKENDTKVKLRKAIKHVAHKNSKMLNEFRVKNPDCLKTTSKVSDKYNKLVFEALGGKGDNDSEKEDKIIKNIAKEVTIDSKV